jgi:hypothetical protein
LVTASSLYYLAYKRSENNKWLKFDSTK